MRYTVRWLYLLKVAVVLAVASAAVAGAHHWQAGKQRGAFLAQADRARESGDAAAEASLLQRYLVVRPDDTDARVRLAKLRVAAAQSRDQRLDAYLLLEDAVRRSPDDEALRRFAAETAMDPRVGLFDEARAHLDKLIEKHPADGKLEEQAARCLAYLRKFPDAEKRFRRAYEKSPDLVDAYAGAVEMLRLSQGPQARELADGVVAEMLTKNPGSAPAALAAARYWRQAGPRGQRARVAAQKVADAQEVAARDQAKAAGQKVDPDQWKKMWEEMTVGAAIGQLLKAAQKLAPDDLDVLLAAARDAYDRAQEAAAERDQTGRDKAVDEARKLLARAVEKHPKEARAYLTAAALEADAGAAKEAAEIARKGVDEIPGSAPLLSALADYQVRAGDAAGAEQTLGRLQAAGYSEARLAYLRAQARAAREEWEEAAALLGGLVEKNPRELADDPAFARQVQLAYARCLDQLGEQDRRLAAARAAVPPDPADPLWVAAQVAVAEALAATGKADEALAAFRRVADRAPGVWLGIARLELARALRAAPDKRDWAAADDALARAARVLQDSPAVGALRVALFDQRDGPAAGRKAADELLARHPKDPTAWATAARQDLREGNPARAAQTLDKAAAAGVKDEVELRLARGQVLAADKAKTPGLAAELGKLADAGPPLPKPQQRRLLRGLAEIGSAAGAAGAAGLWDRAAAAQPKNIGLQLARFDLAVRAGDEAAVDRAVAGIRDADGANGQTARLVSALTTIRRAQRKAEAEKKPADLADAQKTLEGLERERPDWARAEFALAVVYDLQGKPDAALAKYREAVEDGEASPDAARRLAELLFDRGRLAEAEAAVRRLPEGYTGGGARLERMRTQFLLAKDPKAALAAAEKVVPAGSASYEDQLWLGQVASGARDAAKAEAALRRAADLKPDRPAAWLALVRVLAAAGKRDDAARAAAEAEGKVAPADRGLFGAQAAALLGKTDEAVGRFKKAREERPGDLRVLQAEAEYLFNIGQLKEAQQAFRRVIDKTDASADEKAFATRMLSVCLAADRDPATARDALRVLGLLNEKGEVNVPPPNAPAADRRAAAQALALQKDRPSKLKAAEFLEAVGLAALDPAELYLLAQVYQAVGGPNRRVNVRRVMTELLARADNVPLYASYYAAWLLKEGDPAAAARWVDRYAELRPGTLLAAELKARLAVADGKPDEAAKLLRARADGPDAPLVLLARVAEEVGLADEAERLFRRAADRGRAATPPQPAAALPLAGFLGRRGKTGPAVDLIGEARAAGLPAVGGPDGGWVPPAVVVLYAAKVPPTADADRVAGWVEEARNAAGPREKPALTQHLGSVRNAQGKYEAAADLYRQAIAANPRDVIALNNLAYLESLRGGKHDDALRLIGQAKAVIGQYPDLLDTEAVIRLGMREPEKAVELMRGVAAEAPSGTAYFHLAQAELAAGRKDDARQAWKDAQAAGLTPADLHPLERPGYAKLEDELKK